MLCFGYQIRNSLMLLCLGLLVHQMWIGLPQCAAGDRTTFVIPQRSGDPTNAPPDAVFADEALQTRSLAWRGYIYVWKQHRAKPSDPTIRRFLGLPLTGVVQAKSKSGRSAPKFLNWRNGSYQQIDTPHFTIYSQADNASAKRIAEDLESCYWIWTQLFFPFWEGSLQVTALMKDFTPGQNLIDYLNAKNARITSRRKLRVVLFRDAAEYQRSLAPKIPGIERSTGFYSDSEKMTFLYADDNDAATRRHELVHQLFRQASNSGLGRSSPGKLSNFWLVEGIAGYFESLHLADGLATVGGWDSPRLQFARYRMLASGDSMQFDELAADGQERAQQQQDIARWYAHAIAQTHHFADCGDLQKRRWLYRQLADVYKIRTDIDGKKGDAVQRSLIGFLKINDALLKQSTIRHRVRTLCLSGCEVTGDGIGLLPASDQITWLDLSRLPIGNADVTRLVTAPSSLRQLTLEATRVDSGLAQWLSGAKNLRELDLSSTPMNDSIIESIAGAANLQTLWMTGTKVTDASIPIIANFKELESVDLQLTKVTAAGLSQLKNARPKLQINPLELRTQ